jgi:hypothetical protein
MVFFHVDTVGVLKMIDTLSSDIEKEMAVATSEEKNAQADYEETIRRGGLTESSGDDETATTTTCCVALLL